MRLDCYEIAVLVGGCVLAVIALIHGIGQIREAVSIMRGEQLHKKKKVERWQRE